MPLENATKISQLDSTYPAGSDNVDKGDDHIRMIKAVLKNAFKGPGGNGFDTPLTVDPNVLNSLATTLNDINAKIAAIRPIGSIEIRLDNVNPSTLFPGTWTLISGDACLAVGTQANAGSISGNNTPTVPLPQHNHAMYINSAGQHVHGGNVGKSGYSFEHHQYNSRMPMESWQHQTDPAGNHTHDCGIYNAGVANATIDVRGARLYCAIWKRTA